MGQYKAHGYLAKLIVKRQLLLSSFSTIEVYNYLLSRTPLRIKATLLIANGLGKCTQQKQITHDCLILAVKLSSVLMYLGAYDKN